MQLASMLHGDAVYVCTMRTKAAKRLQAVMEANCKKARPMCRKKNEDAEDHLEHLPLPDLPQDSVSDMCDHDDGDDDVIIIDDGEVSSDLIMSDEDMARSEGASFLACVVNLEASAFI